MKHLRACPECKVKGPWTRTPGPVDPENDGAQLVVVTCDACQHVVGSFYVTPA